MEEPRFLLGSEHPPVVTLPIRTAWGMGRCRPGCGMCFGRRFIFPKGTPVAIKATAECLLWATFQTKCFCNYIV